MKLIKKEQNHFVLMSEGQIIASTDSGDDVTQLSLREIKKLVGESSLKEDFLAVLERSGKDANPFEKQGVILFKDNERPFKILNSKYQEYLDVRGNQMSVPFRYIQVRGTSMERTLKELYPEYSNRFSEYEVAIKNIAKETIIEKCTE
jgi:hypothetical protein